MRRLDVDWQLHDSGQQPLVGIAAFRAERASQTSIREVESIHQCNRV